MKWLLPVLFVACGAQDRQEATGVAQAMERFRRAENPQKPSMVETLRAAPCHAPDVCRARDVCLASADATAKALRLKSEVEQTLASIESTDASAIDAGSAITLLPKLDEAEVLLKQGFDGLPACDDQILALKRRYSF